MATAIEFNNVGKMYRLGRVGTGTLSHDLNRWWQMSVLGKEDPYLKIGQTNDRTQKGDSDYVWALRDISFKVEQGEVLGIIGKNGAGKSTLLKLLSNITSPSTGSIRYQGRIASLLEVGTGFHPEMTGRENIYMNGSIMGMTKHEITRKLDEIVDFAGVERYLDTPVKRYSSGMTVRLGFAVAAFLEPEILVVDEVLTVGDAEFQKKAIGKMHDVSHEGGRTVLFVSHNMAAVKKLCRRGLVLENGTFKFEGGINEAVQQYIGGDSEIIQKITYDDIDNAPGNDIIRMTAIEILSENGNKEITIESGIKFKFSFMCFKEKAMIDINIRLKTLDDIVIFQIGKVLGQDGERDSKKGLYTVEYSLPPYMINASSYKVQYFFGENQQQLIYEGDDFRFDVQNVAIGGKLSIPPGILRPQRNFNIKYEG